MKRSLALAIKKELISFLGACVGILSELFAIVVICLGTGSYASYGTYGGDAYTGMQNASATAANNILSLMESVHIIGAAILFIIGGFILFYFLDKVYKVYMSDECLVNIAPLQYQAPSAAPGYMPNFEFCSECGTQYDKNAGPCPNCQKNN